ncbi:hypothetical protein K438DRAFT_1991407 [Mycena galopus ATCC 62051]|nr:hypothetical protein K438DRAFT_1991407 [Mycena galopus ATCC 62051]
MPPPIALSDGSDSDGESLGNGDEGQEYLQPVDIDASKADIIAGYKSCQLELGRVLAENRCFCQRLSELESTATSKRRQRDQSDNRLGYKAHVGPWARLFFLTKEGWVRKEDFRARPSEISLDPEARFTSNTVYSHAITSALYDIVPERFHSLLDSGHYRHLAKDFTTEISGARSSTINSLRGVIASILSSAGYTVNSQILGVAAADRSQDKVLLALLRFPEDKASKLFAPILFPKGQKKMQFIFLSKIVLDIHRVMVYGPSSLAANSKPDAKSNGVKYGVFEATTHSVALAGTLARFLVSADKTFADVGAITKIKWEADYRTYRKLLASNPDAPFVKHIFKTVNSHVFAGISKTVGRAEEDGDDNVEAEISEAMQHLAFGDFDDPAESDDDGPVGEPDPRDAQPAVAGPSHTRRARISEAPPQIHDDDTTGQLQKMHAQVGALLLPHRHGHLHRRGEILLLYGGFKYSYRRAVSPSSCALVPAPQSTLPRWRVGHAANLPLSAPLPPGLPSNALYLLSPASTSAHAISLCRERIPPPPPLLSPFPSSPRKHLLRTSLRLLFS